MHAQVDFKLDGRDVQVHSFASQGFAYSNDNNYLTMKTSSGSFAMTDAGVNISMQVTERFRVGAQVYVRDIGQLGKFHPQLDWAVGDYRFAQWFGIRGGKVKTTLGLYNDTQDMGFLHTYILLPQSVYPTDLRDATIAHMGGDLYGRIPLKRLGELSYTTYAGQRQDSRYGGYIYMLQGAGINYNSYGGLQYGADLRWNTPLKGVLVGASHMNENIDGQGIWTLNMALYGGTGIEKLPTEEHSLKDQTDQFYGQYTFGNLRIDTEYRRYWRDERILSGLSEVTTDTRSWYAGGSYRISKWIELGGYYSRFSNMYHSLGSAPSYDTSAPDHHLYDKVLSARVDLNPHWNVKVEGHFMDGDGSPGMYPDGFYTANNPAGLKPKTNALMIQTGFNF